MMNLGLINSLQEIGGMERLKKIWYGFNFTLNGSCYIFYCIYDRNYENNKRYEIKKNGDVLRTGTYNIIEYFNQL